MDQTDVDVAALKRYLRSKGYRLGQGKIFDTIGKIITEDGFDDDLKRLNKVMADPRQAAALMGLMLEDMPIDVKRAKKKVRRGVGSY